MAETGRVVPLHGAEDGDEALDRVFSALADPIRRAILGELDRGPRLVSELAEPFDISLQGVSRHIQVLVRAGLVHQQRTGRIARCSLDVGQMFKAAVWINRYTKYWEAQFETLAAWLDAVAELRPRAKAPRGGRSPSRTEPPP